MGGMAGLDLGVLAHTHTVMGGSWLAHSAYCLSLLLAQTCMSCNIAAVVTTWWSCREEWGERERVKPHTMNILRKRMQL